MDTFGKYILLDPELAPVSIEASFKFKTKTFNKSVKMEAKSWITIVLNSL